MEIRDGSESEEVREERMEGSEGVEVGDRGGSGGTSGGMESSVVESVSGRVPKVVDAVCDLVLTIQWFSVS